MKKISILTVLVGIILFTIPSFNSFSADQDISSDYSSMDISSDHSSIIQSVNITAVQQHVQFFSELETRAVGYPGSEIAAQYVYDTFLDYGLENVSFQEFPVVDAIDHGANLTVLETGEVSRVYPIEPNLVVPSTTSPEGVTGLLIYVGDGFLSDFDGKEVEGSIVVMDWYSDENWLVAAKLGAKAVVFLPPKSPFSTNFCTSYGGKSVEVPIEFPRFYAPDAEFLSHNINETVCIRANTRWESFMSKNVLAFVEGENPDVIVVLSAYYDSGGVVPSLAPGAQEACGISALLEIARYLHDNPPKCTVMFAAFSAHHHGLEGSIEFSNDYIRRWDPEKREIGDKIYFWFNLDLSTGSDAILFTGHSGLHTNYFGYMYDTQWAPIPEFLGEVLEDINQNSPEGRTYDGIIVDSYGTGFMSSTSYITKIVDHNSYTLFLYDHIPTHALGPFEMGGGYIGHGVVGYVFTTAHDSRPYYGNPYGGLDAVDFDNLQSQLELTYCLLSSILYMEDLEERFVVGLGLNAKLDPENPDPNWFSISGKVGFWNETENWYDPVPNAVVHLSLAGTPGLYRVTLSGEEGSFTFRGNINQDKRKDYTLTAYQIDSSTGAVLYAPDQGRHMYPEKGSWTPVSSDVGWFSVFKAATFVLFDATDPGTLSYAYATEGRMRELHYSVYDAEDFVTLKSWGYLGSTSGKKKLFTSHSYSYSTFYMTSVLAVPPETPFVLTARWVGDRISTFFLLNSSEGCPDSGYTLEAGQQLLVPFTSLSYAESFYWASHDLFSRLIGVNSMEEMTSPYDKHLQVWSLIDEAYEASATHQYSRSNSLAVKAWSIGKDVYQYTRTKAEDAASVVPLFAFLLIPFLYLLERLVFNFAGVRRLITFVALFIGTLTVLYLLHPGFSFAVNPLMIVVAASIIILLIPMLLITFEKTASLIETMRVRLLGRHAAAISRGDELICAFSVGVNQMRRRRLRSTLTIISMIIMVAAIVSFTSISVLRSTAEKPIIGSPLYNGIYMHKYSWGYGESDVGRPLLDYLEASYGELAVIAPRAWKYTLWPTALDIHTRGFRVTYNGSITRTPVIWGLTPQENEVSLVDGFLVGGRWFIPTDSRTCVLTEGHAEKLGIDPNGLPARVVIENQVFVVVGVISDRYFWVMELDGEEISPLKLDVFENPYNIHVTADEVLILTFKDTLTLFGGGIASISMKFEDIDTIPWVVKEIQETLDRILIWSCIGEETKMHSMGLQISIFGLEHQIVLLAIVAFFILNLGIASVYERKGEISTLAVVGLSPSNVSMIFFTEMIIYSLVGAMIGYLVGLFMCRSITAVLPGTLSLNYSSPWVAISVLSAMGVAVIASIYPLYQASRLVTPSLKRTFEISTKPIGDLWEIPLPFHVTEEEELRGIISYLAEYLESHAGEEAPEFTVRNLRLKSGKVRDSPFVNLTMELSLYPYDLGVIQATAIQAARAEERWNFSITHRRLGGSKEDWVKLNQKFTVLLRRQILLWRSLPWDEKIRYGEMFDKAKVRMGGE